MLSIPWHQFPIIPLLPESEDGFGRVLLTRNTALNHPLRHQPACLSQFPMEGLLVQKKRGWSGGMLGGFRSFPIRGSKSRVGVIRGIYCVGLRGLLSPVRFEWGGCLSCLLLLKIRILENSVFFPLGSVSCLAVLGLPNTRLMRNYSRQGHLDLVHSLLQVFFLLFLSEQWRVLLIQRVWKN